MSSYIIRVFYLFLVVAYLVIQLNPTRGLSASRNEHENGIHGRRLAVDYAPSAKPPNEFKWIYKEGEQFPPGSENIELPHMLLYTIFMGDIVASYKHIELTLESMRLNPKVQFVLINIATEKHTAHAIREMKRERRIPNFHVKVSTFADLSHRVKRALDIEVEFNASWYYKLCDYKPTLALLYPEFLVNPKHPYKFWGYADMDLIWGNISRFSHWFTGEYLTPFTGWHGPSGAAAFYINEPWTYHIFNNSKKYIPLLKNLTYHNLDESGLSTHVIVDEGYHCITDQIYLELDRRNSSTRNWGKDPRDHAFIENMDSVEWAGMALWHRGSVKIIHSSKWFPANRELMFYHRMEKVFDPPPEQRRGLLEDMLNYGFFLPSFIPLFSRYMCRGAAYGKHSERMADYQPYNPACYGK